MIHPRSHAGRQRVAEETALVHFLMHLGPDDVTPYQRALAERAARLVAAVGRLEQTAMRRNLTPQEIEDRASRLRMLAVVSRKLGIEPTARRAQQADAEATDQPEPPSLHETACTRPWGKQGPVGPGFDGVGDRPGR